MVTILNITIMVVIALAVSKSKTIHRDRYHDDNRSETDESHSSY